MTIHESIRYNEMWDFDNHAPSMIPRYVERVDHINPLFLHTPIGNLL